MSDTFFEKDFKYWDVAKTIKKLYMSESAISTMLDFERVLDGVDLYAFANWDLGELVEGPIVGKYTVSCVFMWPEKLMPDPRGCKRLLPYDCGVHFKKTSIKIPTQVDSPDDMDESNRRPRIIDKKVWFIEITMPKSIMAEIKERSIDASEEELDMQELDDEYDLTDQFNDEMGMADPNMGMDQGMGDQMQQPMGMPNGQI